MGSMFSKGGPKTMSSLSGPQKDIAGQIAKQLKGPLSQPAANYNTAGANAGKQVLSMNAGMNQAYQGLRQANPMLGVSQGLSAIQGALGGAQSMQYNPMNANLGAYQAPQIAGVGYNYNPMQVQSQYSFNPQAVSSTLSFADTQNYIQKGLYDPALLNFQRSTVPTLNEQYAGMGSSFSSRRGYDTALAAESLNSNLAANAANVTMQNEQMRSQQDLAAQQFNVGTGMQNAVNAAQFGMQAQTTNAANALQNAQFGAGLTLQQQQANAQLLAQNQGLRAGLQQSYDFQNSSNQIGLAESAASRQLQAGQLAGQLGGQAIQNQLGILGGMTTVQNQDNQQQMAQYQEWLRKQAPSPYMGAALSFVGQPQMAAYNQQPGLGSSLLGLGLGSMFGGAGGFMGGLLSTNPAHGIFG